MDLSTALSLVLKKYRLNLNLSQEELAFKSNLDRTYISMLERGKRKPTLETIFKICESLEISTSQFINEIECLLK